MSAWKEIRDKSIGKHIPKEELPPPKDETSNTPQHIQYEEESEHHWFYFIICLFLSLLCGGLVSLTGLLPIRTCIFLIVPVTFFIQANIVPACEGEDFDDYY